MESIYAAKINGQLLPAEMDDFCVYPRVIE